MPWSSSGHISQVTFVGSSSDSRFLDARTKISSGAATAYVPIFVNAKSAVPSSRTLTWSTCHMIWTSPVPFLDLLKELTASM